MRILVTGCNGRVGRELLAELRNRGHRVRGMDLADGPATPIPYVSGSLTDDHALSEALEDIDIVVHLAAFMSWRPEDAQEVFETNVQGTFKLLQVASKHSVQRFVFASSGEVYPELAPVYLPIDEAHPTHPNSLYGVTKLVGEELVKHYGLSTGRSYCILRFSHTQSPEELLSPDSFFSGPRFYVNAKLQQLQSMPRNEAVAKSIEALEAVAQAYEQHYIGCDPRGRPYYMGICDVRDLANGIAVAAEHPAAHNETFNLGPKASCDFSEVVPYLARATGLNVVKANLHTTPYAYETSIAKAERLLGYHPRFDVQAMIDFATSKRSAAI